MSSEINTGWKISSEKRDWYRQKSKSSAIRKKQSKENVSKVAKRHHRLNNSETIPQLSDVPIECVSLFSGCGGLDIGFERAGFGHVLSADILDICAETLRENRPNWTIFGGPEAGDVRNIDWHQIKSECSKEFLVVHGGPPCQPFSNSGKQRGEEDPRDMVPEFFRAVSELQPDAFCMENVPALGSKKFTNYLDNQIKAALGKSYFWSKFYMFAPHFGVPQRRERLFVVGFRDKQCFLRFQQPQPTHSIHKFSADSSASLKKFMSAYPVEQTATLLPNTYGVREAIGLNEDYPDGLAPTFRSGFTGPRNSTSILNGASSQNVFARMGIWGNGVAASIAEAEAFVPENGHTRLSISDCAIIQGFPKEWKISGPVYKAIGQIGNSVAPPVAYAVAKAIKSALMQ